MQGGNYPIIAREAWVGLILLLLAAVIVTASLGWWYSVPFWLLYALGIFLFRDPEREIPSQPLAIVSPVDGRIVSIKQDTDPFLDREAIRIAIKMNPLGIFGIRSPMEGKIMNRWFLMPGDIYPGRKEAVRMLQIATWIQSDEGDDIILSLGKGRRMPRCYVHQGDRIGQGQRCGFIPFGAPLEVLVPANARIALQAGDKIHAGSDVIAQLIHRSET